MGCIFVLDIGMWYVHVIRVIGMAQLRLIHVRNVLVLDVAMRLV